MAAAPLSPELEHCPLGTDRCKSGRRSPKRAPSFREEVLDSLGGRDSPAGETAGPAILPRLHELPPAGHPDPSRFETVR